MDPRLITYVQQERSRGVPDDTIREALRSAGWDEQTIREALTIQPGGMHTPSKNLPAERLVRLAKRFLTPENIVNTAYQLEVYSALYQTGKALVFLAIFIPVFILLMILGLPWPIGLFFISFFILLFILQLMTVKRLLSLRLTPTHEASSHWEDIPGEEVRMIIPGIMRLTTLRGSSFLGVGRIHHPENTLIITNKRLLFITIPLPGSEVLIGGSDPSLWYWLLARGEIEKRARDLIATRTPAQLLNMNPHNYAIPLDALRSVRFSRFLSTNMHIITRDGKRYAYAVRSKDDFARLKNILRAYTRR